MSAYFKELVCLLRQGWKPLALGWSLVLAAAWWLHPHDPELLGRLIRHWNQTTAQVAHQLYIWGNATRGPLILVAGLWCAGWLGRRNRWRRAALVCLLAIALAGLLANILRFSTGRPRPRITLAPEYYHPEARQTYNAKGFFVPDRFTGFTMEKRFQSFPSAHVSTTVAPAVALLLTLPVAGGPAVVAALAVAWSRMYKLDHYPTDVLVGLALGVTCGLFTGLAERRVRRP
jgi:membrane-associated phospholipid phosphatase